MWRDSESEQDFLNFTELADQIATLSMNGTLLPISIGVFGGWGTGKSPILIKFDAWLYQGFDDARAALMELVSGALLDAAKRDATLLEGEELRWAGELLPRTWPHSRLWSRHGIRHSTRVTDPRGNSCVVNVVREWDGKGRSRNKG
jgi:hypothetical protein